MKIKFIIRFISLLILFYSCHNNNKATKNDLQKEGLRGSVKSVKETTYQAEVKDGEIQKGKIFIQLIKTFNEKGNILEENGCWPDRNDNLKNTCIYDHNEELLGVICYIDIDKINGTDYKIYFATIYKNDNIGNKIEEKNYNQGTKLNSISTFKYDEKGNCIEDSAYSPNGSLNSYSIYQYDDKGNKIKENDYKSDGTLKSKSGFKYDNYGNNIEYVSYKLDGIIDHKTVYSYEFDAKGSWIKKFTYDGNNNTLFDIVERKIIYYK